MLQAVKHFNMTLFSVQEWVFQQDSVPAHKAKTTQEWLQRNLLAFINAKDWLSGSADFIPLDNKLWAVLVPKVSQQPEDIPSEGSSRDPPGDGVCGDSRVAGASQGLRRGRGPPF